MVQERKLVLTKAFEKSYQKFAKKDLRLKSAIHKALTQLQTDAFNPVLKTHKLSGKLACLFSLLMRV